MNFTLLKSELVNKYLPVISQAISAIATFIDNHLDTFLKLIFLVIAIIFYLILNSNKTILKSLLKENKKNYYNKIKNSKISDKIFPNLLNERSKNDKQKEIIEVNDNIKSFINLINEKNAISIIGEGGYGKSSIIQYLYCYLIDKSKKNIPIYINFSDLSTNTILEHLQNSTQLIKFEKIKWLEYFPKLKRISSLSDFYYSAQKAKKYNVYIFLDGYDEILYNKNLSYNAIDKELSELLSNKPENIKVVLTSRFKYTKSNLLVLRAQKLTPDKVKKYLNKSDFDENIVKYIDNPQILTMYKKSLSDERALEHIKYKEEIKSKTDIYWNYYCYLCEKNFNIDDDKLSFIFIRYILPYIAYNVDYKFGCSFSQNDIITYTEQFCENLESFKQCFISNELDNWRNITKELIIDYVKNELNLKSYPIINYKDNLNYSFNHNLNKNFYAAVYEYYKDVCILNNANYKTEKLDEKTTINKWVRIYYSDLIKEYIDNHSDLPNKVKLSCIKSDLYYFGDSQNRDLDKALETSKNAYDFFKNSRIKRKDPNYSLSVNWVEWNIAFIVFENIRKKKSLSEISDKEIRDFKNACDLLKDAMNQHYAPAFDKFAHLYFDKKLTVAANEYIFDENEKVKDEKEAAEKAKEYLERGEEGGYHFASNKYGTLYERNLLPSSNYIKEAYEHFQKSVKADPGDLWAVSRCAFHLIHNYEYLGYIKSSAMKDASDYLEKGYNYFQVLLEDEKAYGIQGIYNLIENYAEYHLIKMIDNTESDMTEAIELYNTIFTMYEKDPDFCNDELFSYEPFLKDLLCYFIITQRSENPPFSNILSKKFDEAFNIVISYFNNDKNRERLQQSSIFHNDRFINYFDKYLIKKE